MLSKIDNILQKLWREVGETVDYKIT